MNKPILFVLYISLASVVGFISGIYFGGPHKKDVVLEALVQHDEVQKLMGQYGLIVSSKYDVEELEKIKSLDGVEELILKRKRNGMTHVKLFNKQAMKMKNDAPNNQAILELETSVRNMEKSLE